MKDIAPCRSAARIPFSSWMFLKTFSAGWSSGDCSEVVCATPSGQEINAVTKKRKAIARVVTEHPRVPCWSISNRSIPLAAKWVRAAAFFYALFYVIVGGQKLNKFGAKRSLAGVKRTARREPEMERRKRLPTEDGLRVRAVFRGNSD